MVIEIKIYYHFLLGETMNYFWTVCVPCYNPDERLEKLLDSVIAQNCKDDIEVVIIDDCSTKDYSNILDKFKDKLNIFKYETKLNGGPGPTRQRGIEHSTGEWITFIDQDDVFLPDVFKDVKKQIEEYPTIQTLVNTPFYIIDATTNQTTQYLPNADNWIHGKFYHRENFLLKYNIHFCEDLYSHEDIYFSTLVKGVLNCNKLPYIQCNTPTYNWYTYADSLSHKETETGLNYLEEYFGEYIDSILEPVMQLDKQYKNKDFTAKQLLTLLLFGYFYIQGFLYYNSTNFKRDNITKFRQLLDYTEDCLGLTNDEIIQWTYNNPKDYFDIREKAAGGTGPMIETYSYASFINEVKPQVKNNDS